jgi:lanthanide-dependent methanol dehydrogenase
MLATESLRSRGCPQAKFIMGNMIAMNISVRNRVIIACMMAIGAIIAFILGCEPTSEGNDARVNEPQPVNTNMPTGASQTVQPDDGQWTMAAKNFASTRYSELTQITTDNVAQLKVAWTFSIGVNRGQEAAPLVVGDTMYLVTPFPNILYALDLNNSGATKWKYEPNPNAAAQGVACCDLVNRGCAYSGGKIFFNTLDAHTVSVDAKTGREVWKAKLGDINRGETITMAPLVVKDKVLVGNSGGEFGVRGWITALSKETGAIAWRAYSTGPDADCLIGTDFKPHYDMDKGKDLGVQSWPPNQWKIGGGTVWGWISYDPDLNLIYYGTGNPGPWNSDARPGDNKWTCGIFARDPDTGQARWFYQFSPHDLFDHDAINENLLLDLPIDGAVRKVLVRPERNGYVYVMDRATGQVLSATAFVRITSSKGVDLETGRLIRNDEKKPQLGKVVRDITPVSAGAKDWCPSAFSPRTGLIYMPHVNLSMDLESTEANYIAGTPYLGVNARYYAGPGGHRGVFTAWDPVNKSKAWSIDEKFPCWSGVVTTAGNLVFYGTMDGWFKAVNARDGTEIWKFKAGSGIVGQPITYRAPDGKQYVAVLSGVGGWAGAIVSGDLDGRDSTAALGFAGAMKDLPQHTTKGGMLYVFSLP